MTVLQERSLSSQDWYQSPASRTGNRPSAHISPARAAGGGQDNWGPAPIWLPPQALQRIRQLRNLHDGWDGYGSSGVSHRLADAVLKILADPRLVRNPPLPRIAPTADGGIAVEWRTAVAIFELDFTPPLVRSTSMY